MSTFSIAIKTKDRSPRKNYLAETVQNLSRAGVLRSELLASMIIVNSTEDSAWMVADDFPLEGRPWLIDSVDRSLHQNAAASIRWAAEPDADYAMVLEDDLDFSDDFLESVSAWIEDNAVSRPQMFALGANYSQIQSARTVWAYPVSAFYGAQALVWKREDAQQLAEWLGPDPFYIGKDGQIIRNHGHDLLLQRWGKQQGLSHFVASAPCMVQHIGEESGIGNRFFSFPWGGRDWRYERRAPRGN
jgi:hypothetical protein